MQGGQGQAGAGRGGQGWAGAGRGGQGSVLPSVRKPWCSSEQISPRRREKDVELALFLSGLLGLSHSALCHLL